MDGVIIDTSIWAPAFRRRPSPEKIEVQRLINEGSAVLVGIVYAELLRGAQDDAGRTRIEDRLAALDYLESTKETWRHMGNILNRLRLRGEMIPVPDALIAALALENNCALYSNDPHFDKVPGLIYHEVGA